MWSVFWALSIPHIVYGIHSEPISVGRLGLDCVVKCGGREGGSERGVTFLPCKGTCTVYVN